MIRLGFKCALVILVLLFSMTFVFADSRCPDYCSNEIHYSSGTYNSRTADCTYLQEVCNNGCDSHGIDCSTIQERTDLTNANDGNNPSRNTDTDPSRNTDTDPPRNTSADSPPRGNDDPPEDSDQQSGDQDIVEGKSFGLKQKLFEEASNVAPVLVETFNAISEMVQGFLQYWPDAKGREFYGSEILIENHNKQDLIDISNDLKKKYGNYSDNVDEELDQYFGDLFTFYLPGEECSIVVDTCPVNKKFGDWEKYVALDSLLPKVIWETESCGLFCQLNAPGECPEGFGACGKYKYKFTPSQELANLGLEPCVFVLKKPPSQGFVLEGEVCASDSYAKTLEEGDGIVTVMSWNCGLLDEPFGEPICYDWANATGQMDKVLSGTLSSLSDCTSYKAEDIDGGFHFFTVKGTYSYLRYTYACRNKGWFG